MTPSGVNIFAVGRRTGDENQLTKFLAALFEKEPQTLGRFASSLDPALADLEDWRIELERVHSLGRFDLVASLPDEAVVVVEAKIHADLASDQVHRYLSWLTRRNERFRALVLLTRREVTLTAEDVAFADQAGIHLEAKLWQELTDCLVTSPPGTLAADFTEMLMNERLASPTGVRADDLHVLHAAPRVFARLADLVKAAASRLAKNQLELQTATNIAGEKKITATLAVGTRRLRIGVEAHESRRPDTLPIVWVALTDTAVDPSKSRGWAEERAKAIGECEASSAWVVRTAPAAEFLQAATLDKQAARLAEFALALLHDDNSVVTESVL